MVGNDFVLPRPKMQAVKPAAMPRPAAALAQPVLADTPIDFETHAAEPTHRSPFRYSSDLFHRYSLGAFALLFLLVGSSAIQVSALYLSANIEFASAGSTSLRIANPQHGPNLVIANDKLASTLVAVTGQSLNLTIGTKTVPVAPDTIKSWLQVVNDKAKGVTYVHVNDSVIAKSLTSAAAPFVKAPTDQVTLTRPDGSSRVIATGHNGTKLGDTNKLAREIGKNVLGAKGMQMTLPLETLPFNAVTPTAFDKMLEVDVTTKQMWAYDKGQLTRQFPISAGAPETPTPIGQYKIYQKLAVQDMRGYNPNGTKYFQPHVRWVNYFLPGGYAVHGNYWRPLSYFGAINSSHGCVSLPDDQAKWVYDWAPIGTTVITHT
ncbi:MAG: L,D-transpeptidase [Patescibacteria group bacterium]|mgnify:CR=1 FL=1